jgi:hypothetical protein
VTGETPTSARGEQQGEKTGRSRGGRDRGANGENPGGGTVEEVRSRRAGAGDMESHRWQRLVGVVKLGALVRVRRVTPAVRRRIRLTLARERVGRRAGPPRGQPGEPSGARGRLHRARRGAFRRHRSPSGGPARRLGVRDCPESGDLPAPWGITIAPRDRGGRAWNVDPSFPATAPFDDRSARDEREGSASPRPRLRVRHENSAPRRRRPASWRGGWARTNLVAVDDRRAAADADFSLEKFPCLRVHEPSCGPVERESPAERVGPSFSDWWSGKLVLVTFVTKN